MRKSMVEFAVIMTMLHLTSSLVLDTFFVMAYATMNDVVKL
jgi:hypothetical protein